MRYIRYKIEKQQINFLNCNKIDEWIDTCHTRETDFIDVCTGNCECGSTIGSGNTSGDTTGSTSGCTIYTTVRGNGSESVGIQYSITSKKFDKLLIDGVSVSTGTTKYVFNDFEIHNVDYFGVNSLSYFFTNSKTITAIILDGLESIGHNAFENCSSLTSVTIPDSVKFIEYSAFTSCRSLTSVTIPNSVTSIGNKAFENCSSLTSIVIPDSVTDISGSFTNCTNLTSVTIGNSVTTIGSDIGSAAFGGCKSLSSIIIPASVTRIYQYSFSGCTSLTSVTCCATNSPFLYNGVFDGLPTNGTLHVPQGSDYSTWLRELPSHWKIEYI